MDCPQIPPDNVEYMKRLHGEASSRRIPLSGGIEITRKCNFRCIHCYLATDETKNEIGTDRWKGIIDEIAAAGCLFLLFTGGEPLARKDFPEIYRHAKLKGLIVTVFTNASMITGRIAELFEDLPPHAAEVSLYGASDATYEKITGISGAYRQCVAGIEKLLDAGINVQLKTVLMTENRHEFHEIENFAKSRGLGFRFDPAIFPRFSGDRTPLAYRIPPGDAARYEFSNADKRKQWEKFYNRVKDNPPPETLYSCGAGITAFHVDSYGNLQPCLMTDQIKNALRPGNFLQCWQDMGKIREKTAKADFKCIQCEKRELCGYCPAFFNLENGSEDRPSEYICELGRYRWKALV